MALNLSALQSAYDNTSKSNNNSTIQWMKLKKGITYLHVLPPWDNGDLPFFDVWIHFMTDENGDFHTFQCAKRFESGKCVLCDRVNSLINSSDENEIKLGKNMKAKHVHLYNVCTSDFEPQVLSAGPKVHGAILYEIKEDVSAGFDPTAYKGGVMIKVERTDKGSWNTTDYKARAERNRIDLPDSLAANHANLPKLDQIYAVYSNVELDQVLSGNFDPKGLKAARSAKASSESSAPSASATPPATVTAAVIPAVVSSAAPAVVAPAPVAPAPVAPAPVAPAPVAPAPVVPAASVGSIVKNKPSLEEARRILNGGSL